MLSHLNKKTTMMPDKECAKNARISYIHVNDFIEHGIENEKKITDVHQEGSGDMGPAR